MSKQVQQRNFRRPPIPVGSRHSDKRQSADLSRLKAELKDVLNAAAQRRGARVELSF
jgi:hypothetical protein